MSAQAITLYISPRGKPINALPEELSIPRNASTAELYYQVSTFTGLPLNQLRVTKGSDGTFVTNSRDLPLGSTGLMDGSKICVKDLGQQIAWRTVFVVEYIGPLIIHPLVYLLRPYIYSSPSTFSFPPPSTTQKVSLLLICLHFLKREYETLYIHRFSAATMPFRNIFKNSFHYWVLAGLNIAYWTYRPSGPTAQQINPLFAYPGLLLFAVGELGNLNAHAILRSLRSSGGKERGIPHGLGFDLVTCPNYMFEALAWVGMCLVTRDLATVLFTLVSVGQMAVWAKKKERNYRREFGDKYKKKRYALMPGIY